MFRLDSNVKLITIFVEVKLVESLVTVTFVDIGLTNDSGLVTISLEIRLVSAIIFLLITYVGTSVSINITKTVEIIAVLSCSKSRFACSVGFK